MRLIGAHSSRGSRPGKKMMDETMAAERGWAGRRARNFGEQEVEIARHVIRRLTGILADEPSARRLSDWRTPGEANGAVSIKHSGGFGPLFRGCNWFQ